MKKIATLVACLATFQIGFSQASSDSVSIGAGYTDQVWYSLENGEVKSEAKTNWDIAFEIPGISSSIRINHAGGTSAWVYPNGDTSSWNSIDTNGLSTWTPLLNSDTNWSIGALNQDKDVMNDFDMGWGTYDLSTHAVTGNRLFIIQTTSGDFKKFKMLRLQGGIYTGLAADLNGANEEEIKIVKGTYINENFAYFSFDDGIKSREPYSADWQLQFTQYAAVEFGGYPSTGVLMNANVRAVQVYPVDDVSTYEDYSAHAFSTEINTIGFNWKSINFTTFQWDIADSTVYFLEQENGDVYKMIFTGFGGSSSGKYYFTKELIYETAPIDTSDTTVSVAAIQPRDIFLQTYPNPAGGDVLNVVVSGFDGETIFRMVDMNGRIVFESTDYVTNLSPKTIPVGQLADGIYVLQVQQGSNTNTSRVIIQ